MTQAERALSDLEAAEPAGLLLHLALAQLGTVHGYLSNCPQARHPPVRRALSSLRPAVEALRDLANESQGETARKRRERLSRL